MSTRSETTKGKADVDWAAVIALDDAELERRALADPDNPPWSRDELKAAVAAKRASRATKPAAE
jgi:hypothetical protein